MDLSMKKMNKTSESREAFEERKLNARKCLAEHRIVEIWTLADPYDDLRKLKPNASTKSTYSFGVDHDNRMLLKRKASKPLQTTKCDVKPVDLKLDYSLHRVPSNMRITIKNVVTAFRLGCFIDLDYVTQNCFNVEFRGGNNFLRIRLKKPFIMATMWHTGSASVMGASTEDESHIGARRVARIIQKLGYKVRMHNFHVVNVVSSFDLPFSLHTNIFARENLAKASREPEIHTCVVYNMTAPKATFFIHTSGSGTASAGSIELLYEAYEIFYRMIRKYARPHSLEEKTKLNKKNKRADENRIMAKVNELQKANSDILNAPEGYWDK